MDKKFVLDTNVLLHNPNAIDHFGDEEVIVPIYVIEEIDKFKRELSELGRNARHVSRRLDELRGKGNLAHGVPTLRGGKLRVSFIVENGEPHLSPAHRAAQLDDLILALALQEQKREPAIPVIFVTRDVNLRIRADAMGLRAEDFLDDRIEISELYSGFIELEVEPEIVDKLYQEGVIACPVQELFPNQYVLVKSTANANHAALARFTEQQHTLNVVRSFKKGVWGIQPRNKEQHFALDLLLDDNVKLVTLVGKAGTGKTLIAIAAALQKVIEERKMNKLLVSRPIYPLGRDIGFLPGDVEEKLNPWMQPIFDNLEFLLGISQTTDKSRSYREYIEMGYLQVEPLTYIRGRSIPNQYMIVDEAQNLTPHEVKTILTRVGSGTKIVLTGDPYQIDNPYVDSSNNGLSTVVEKFKKEPLAGHVTLTKGERSDLAELAANIL